MKPCIDRLQELNTIARQRGGRCVSSHYTGLTARIDFLCAKGHTFTTSADSILRFGSWCPHCAGNARKSLEPYQRWAREHGGLCLSEDYVNNKTKLLYRCARGHEFAFAPVAFHNGRHGQRWCQICRAVDQRRDKLETIRQRVVRLGYTLLTQTYVDSHHSVLVLCDQGHRWSVRPQNLTPGKRCLQCRQGLNPVMRKETRVETRSRLRSLLKSTMALPVAYGEASITLTHLYLLCTIGHARSITRKDLHDGVLKPSTINKRLGYLRARGLIELIDTSEDRRKRFVFKPTVQGAQLISMLRVGRTPQALECDLLKACDLTRGTRDDTIGAAQLEVLRRVAHENEVTITSLLPYFNHEKPTLVSRLRYLVRHDCLRVQEQSNRGGHSWPNHYEASEKGHRVLNLILS